ncbi:aminopeptidase [Marinobacter sp. M216]|uniref:Aminopeptidase n=1 Tax=Marinobacter albus TaxID=3030833 RepID=A0ABT7H8I2_9GAMM|nr:MULTISPECIES: aminopeptidase [unclassified Marinobacter]MBW7471360.1 aminopeptidase [Marinobacter sp. F4218]MDK9556362.1 aminopeptidase [Marinobacter sp. M216]
MKQLSQIYLLLLLVTGVTGCTTIGYYSQAVSGHLSLMMNGDSVDGLIARGTTPDDLKQKLTTSQQARRFARDALSLPVGDAFTDYVALDRPWVVVNLVAVPEFSLEPHRWCYPVLGCQAYRGYFELDDAVAEQADFRETGYDTFIGGVTAYSTLGWFDDPLHSGFTRMSDDRMVALMFHELAHRVVYIGDDTAFNESFATAVELEGLKLWSDRQGNPDSFQRAFERLQQRNQTLALVETTTTRLESLYQQRDRLPVETLREQKAELLAQLLQDYLELSSQWTQPGPFGENPTSLNNANLALFRQYNQHVPGFRQLLRDQNHDFEAFYRAVEALSKRPETERSRRLSALSERFVEDF